jgi:hypothetical protein
MPSPKSKGGSIECARCSFDRKTPALALRISSSPVTFSFPLLFLSLVLTYYPYIPLAAMQPRCSRSQELSQQCLNLWKSSRSILIGSSAVSFGGKYDVIFCSNATHMRVLLSRYCFVILLFCVGFNTYVTTVFKEP